MTITVRKALRQEIAWINDRYDEAMLKRSHFDQEIIAIAEIDAQRAGLGRLVTLDDRTAELSGVYVLPFFRRQGIAGKIVEFLLEESDKFEQIVCFPPPNQREFYIRFGFVPTAGLLTLSPSVQEKYDRYRRTTHPEVLLLAHSHRE